jgi:hypothetical protein
MSAPRRRLIVALLLAAALLSGCGGRSVQLFTHPNPKQPSLRGRTVAVFPALSLGIERGPAIVSGDALEAVFASELAGIRFVPPSVVVERTRLSEEEIARLSETLSAFLPLFVEPKRRKTPLFSGHRIGNTRLESKLVVTLQRDPYPRKQLSPAMLPTEWFAGLEADYALMSVSFSTYRQVSRTAALLGVLPLFWERRLEADGPRSLFALYEVETGARVFDVIVGVGNPVRAEVPGRTSERRFDLRIMPAVGLAYLLTGEIVGPLERALRPTDQD